MLKVGIDGCQNQVNGNWDKNKFILYRTLLNIITDPKCSEVLNVITFQRNRNHSPKCIITFGLKCKLGNLNSVINWICNVMKSC